MRQAALLLERHTGRRERRVHDGKVMVMRSNLRWCSDGLEFACWNGEIMRMAFIIDAFDREIVAWTAVSRVGISGSDIRDMMLEAVEKRFGSVRAPHPVEIFPTMEAHIPPRKRGLWRRPEPRPLLHAGEEPRVQRNVRSLREDLQARLPAHIPLAGCAFRATADRRMDRRL